MNELKGLDDWITGVHDPNAPFNQDDSDYDQWYDKLGVEDAIEILTYEAYSNWCGENCKGPDDPDNMEAFVQSREETLYDHFIEKIREE